MLKKYPNALLETLRSTDLNPDDFGASQEELEGRKVFTLRFRDTPLLFQFWGLRGELFSCKRCYYKSTYIGGYPNPRYEEESLSPNPFEGVKQYFGRWLNSIKLYLKDQAILAEDQLTPDLWAELALPGADSGSAVALLENLPFSADEQERVSASLRELGRKVEDLHLLSGDQLKVLNEKVDDLVKEAHRPGLGRRDWLAAAAGGLIGYIIQAGLTSEAARQVLQLVGETLRWIVKAPFLLGG